MWSQEELQEASFTGLDKEVEGWRFDLKMEFLRIRKLFIKVGISPLRLALVSNRSRNIPSPSP